MVHVRRILPLPILAAGVILFSFESLMGQLPQAPKVDTAEQPGVETLARGPVHEAYAQPTNNVPGPSPIITKQPPELIEEIPPEQKPEGNDIEWIPGYWSWDDERKDYIWVSGFWRESPPGRDWVAGHWQRTGEGWQWVAGFWTANETTELQYLPPPPPSADEGPSVPAPDTTSTYIPGSWVYSTNRYLWRPGYWAPYNPNYVWIPAYYNWTPGGYLYVNGYWDHPLDDRGLLFAPVSFGPNWQRGRYVPSYVVSADFLLSALFVRTGYSHYYFGNYFDNRYAPQGFVAWPDYRVGRSGYDANFNYYRHHYSANLQWETGMRDLYRARLAGVIARPPLNWAQQVQAVNSIRDNGYVNRNFNITHAQNVMALVPLRDVQSHRVTGLSTITPSVKGVADPGHIVKLQQLAKEASTAEARNAERLRQMAAKRQATQLELMKAGVPTNYTDPARTIPFNLDRSRPAPNIPPTTQPPTKGPANTPPPKTPPVVPPPAKTPPVVPPPAKQPNLPVRPPRVAPPPIPQMPKHVERPLPPMPTPPAPKGGPPVKGGPPKGPPGKGP